MKTASSLPLVVFLFLAASTEADTHHSAPGTPLEAGEAVPPRPVQTKAVVKEAPDTLHEALAAARRIARADDRVSALSHIAEVQTQADDFQGAIRSISEALATARRIAAASDRAWALSRIAQVQAKAGDYEGAARTFSEAPVTVWRVHHWYGRTRALHGITLARARAGDIEGALTTARRIANADRRYRAPLFAKYARFYAAANMRPARAAFPAERPVALGVLRGGLADDGAWRVDPARAGVVVGTVDMVGSRLLFSGYGDGRSRRPMHAGLLGHDALAMLDEAHLAPAFAALLGAMARLQRRPELRTLTLSATGRPRGTVRWVCPWMRHSPALPEVEARAAAPHTTGRGGRGRLPRDGVRRVLQASMRAQPCATHRAFTSAPATRSIAMSRP